MSDLEEEERVIEEIVGDLVSFFEKEDVRMDEVLVGFLGLLLWLFHSPLAVMVGGS